MQYNTTIKVGDRVTWVWDDDEPHTIEGNYRKRMKGVGGGRGDWIELKKACAASCAVPLLRAAGSDALNLL